MDLQPLSMEKVKEMIGDRDILIEQQRQLILSLEQALQAIQPTP